MNYTENNNNELMGVVYKLIAENTELYYIGSYSGDWGKYRVSKHFYNNNSCVSKKLLEYGKISIIILEKSYFKDRTELRKLEQNYIDMNRLDKNMLNINNAYTDNEYKRIQKKKCDKLYYEKNKDKIKNYHKERHKKLMESGFYDINRTERNIRQNELRREKTINKRISKWIDSINEY